MTPPDVQRVLQFLSLLFATSPAITTESVRNAIRGAAELGEIPASIPWPTAEAIIRMQPDFLDKDPARRTAWELRDSDPLNRIALAKALIDAVDNQTFGPIDLLGPDLRARPDLVERLLGLADDIADVLSDNDFPPRQKQQLLSDLLATI
jgi:hypothetical protein